MVIFNLHIGIVEKMSMLRIINDVFFVNLTNLGLHAVYSSKRMLGRLKSTLG